MSRTSSERDGLVVTAFRQLGDDTARCLDAEVGTDEKIFEIVEGVAVELLLSDEAGDAFGEPRRGFGEAFLEALEPAALRCGRRLWQCRFRCDDGFCDFGCCVQGSRGLTSAAGIAGSTSARKAREVPRRLLRPAKARGLLQRGERSLRGQAPSGAGAGAAGFSSLPKGG